MYWLLMLGCGAGLSQLRYRRPSSYPSWVRKIRHTAVISSAMTSLGSDEITDIALRDHAMPY